MRIAPIAMFALLTTGILANVSPGTAQDDAAEETDYRLYFASLPAGAVAGTNFGGGIIVDTFADRPFITVRTSDRSAMLTAAAAIPNFLGYIEPLPVHHDLSPNDDDYVSGELWNLDTVRAPLAWDVGGLASTQTAVCIIDSGVDGTHVDLVGNFGIQPPSGFNTVTTSHGTHVAGIAAAAINNNEGIAGLANVHILAYDSSSRVQAVNWCDAVGPKYTVINMSFQVYNDNGTPDCSDDMVGYDTDFGTQIEEAYDNGRLLVGAAGNCGPGYALRQPASMPEVIAVGNVVQGDGIYGDSQVDPKVEVVAPGTVIRSTMPTGSSGGDYGYKTGTSMAAPHVSGALALAWEHLDTLYGGFDNKAMRARLARTVVDLGDPGRDDVFGFGRLDVLCLIAGGLKCPGPFDWRVDTVCLGSRMTFVDTHDDDVDQQSWTFVDTEAETTTTYPWESPGTSHEWIFKTPTTLEVTLDQDTDGDVTSITRTFDVAACPQTWAAGDVVGTMVVAAGNDPGCRLSDAPDAIQRMPGDMVLNYDLYDPSIIVGLEPLPEPRFLAGGASISGGLAVVGGTSDCAFAPKKSLYLYDEGSDTWAGGANMATARISPAVTAHSGRLMVAGGDKSGGDALLPDAPHIPTPDFEQYDGSWTMLDDMPAGMIGASATTSGSKVIVSGGYSHPQTTNRLVQTYDTATTTWQGPNLPNERTAFGLGTCHGTERILVGGLLGEDVPMHLYVPSAATSQISRYTGTWSTMANLPTRTAFAQVADYGPWIYMHGGLTDPVVGPPSILASDQVIPITCPSNIIPNLSACTGPPQISVIIMTALCGTKVGVRVADGAMEATPCVELASSGSNPSSLTPPNGLCVLLFVFGGTTQATLKGNGYEPDCPNDHVTLIEPVSRNALDLTATTAAASGLVDIRLPIPLAGMGSARLPDGRIVLIGGRTIGPDGDCYTPSKKTFIFDPTTLADVLNGLPVTPFTEGPDLPSGVIGPAVGIREGTVYVMGGDDRGDTVDPASSTQAQPRHPTSQVVILSFSGAGSATPSDGAPLATVRGRLSIVGNSFFMIGGNHHPMSSVRAVVRGAYDPIRGIFSWSDPVLPFPVAHHSSESCLSSPYVLGGASEGTVYHTGTYVEYQLDRAEYSGGTWTDSPGVEQAFGVGFSDPSTSYMVGGSSETAQRSNAYLSYC